MLELLLVDDDEMVRESLAMLFRREGFAVAAAGRGDDAIAAARGQAFDIVVTDIRMPGADGIEVVRQIRELQPDTHFVLITGFASEEATIQALRLRVDDYFRKPFDLPTFVERIRAIGRSRLRAGPDASRGMRRFAELLREVNPAWGEHAWQVADVAAQLGRRLGLDDADLSALRLAATFHDLRNLESGPAVAAPPADEPGGVLQRAASLLCAPRDGDLAGQVLAAALSHCAGQGEGPTDARVREALADLEPARPAGPVPPHDEPPLAIQTLGDLRVSVDGAPIARADWESASARNLFLFLLSERGRRVSEDRIVEAFWPDSGVEKARRAMKTAIYRVRKALRSPDAILTGERYYQWNASLPHAWDLDRMEKGSARARALEASHDVPGAAREWVAAASLHAGPFLEGLEDDWIQPVRERALGTAVTARTRAAALLLQLGDAEAAVQQARGAISLDRTCEEAQALLVGGLAALGRRDEAVRAYHAAAEALDRLLGLGPGPQLLRAYLELTS